MCITSDNSVSLTTEHSHKLVKPEIFSSFYYFFVFFVINQAEGLRVSFLV